MANQFFDLRIDERPAATAVANNAAAPPAQQEAAVEGAVPVGIGGNVVEPHSATSTAGLKTEGGEEPADPPAQQEGEDAVATAGLVRNFLAGMN